MPLTYEAPPVDALRQGEILANVLELQLEVVPASDPLDVSVRPIRHALTVVLTADCDLEQDFNARRDGSPTAHPSLLPYILLGDLYSEPEIRTNLPAGSDIWKRVVKNQDERYHRFEAALIECEPGSYVDYIDDVYLDFRKPLPLQTARLYDGIEGSGFVRRAVVPPVYVHDLMHRFYGYQSRVGVA